MKRTRMIVADDGYNKVSVTVKIDSRQGLMRDEVARMMGNISDGVIKQLADTRHLSVYLSDIRVK